MLNEAHHTMKPRPFSLTTAFLIAIAGIVLAVASLNFWRARPAPPKAAIHLNGVQLTGGKAVFGHPPGQVRFTPTVTGFPVNIPFSNIWFRLLAPESARLPLAPGWQIAPASGRPSNYIAHALARDPSGRVTFPDFTFPLHLEALSLSLFTGHEPSKASAIAHVLFIGHPQNKPGVHKTGPEAAAIFDQLQKQSQQSVEQSLLQTWSTQTWTR